MRVKPTNMNPEIHTCNNGEPCAHREHEVFASKEERDLFNIEEAKAHLISDLHAFEGMVGHEAARKFIETEWSSLPF